MKNTKTASQPFGDASRKMVFIVFGLSIVFILVQFIKLSTVGRIGQEINRINQRQSDLELENELLKSEISKLKSPSNLANSLGAQPNLATVAIKTIPFDSTIRSEVFASAEVSEVN